ncbi:MAG: hypothetical protein J6C96_08025 [Oscillospiraceae bacterium]|nr:hypothetical protein [Oscillospiraceae bacterium]
MNNNQEKVQSALEKIEKGLANINTNEDWLNFLNFQSRFYNYSFGNVLLILMQKPNASYVKGFRAWNELGRYVKKGSKGIAILAPCTRKIEVFKETDKKVFQDKEGEKEIKTILTGFRIAYVYDISDTDGSDEQLPVLVKGLSGNGEQEKAIYETIYTFISKEHTIREVTGTAEKGSYNLETKVISIRSGLEYLQKIKTLLHEYAHLIDFQMHPEEDISRNRRELIAESTAYVVSSYFGLDTSRYSMGYIRSWLKDDNELKEIAETVQKISNTIITNMAGLENPAFIISKEEK